MENLSPTIGNVTRIEYGGQPVVTTAQLAVFYSCDERNIRENFNSNAERFVEGKHYFKLEGNELKSFMSYNENFGVASKFAPHLYLWTKRGAARHCKSVGTDKAWDVFEALEDIYFNRDAVLSNPLWIVRENEVKTWTKPNGANVTLKNLKSCAPHSWNSFSKDTTNAILTAGLLFSGTA